MSGLIHPVRSLRSDGGQIEIRASNPVVLCSGMETSLSGGHRRGETPVPIPNTEVKPSTGDGTNGAIRWESSKLPGFILKSPYLFIQVRAFFLCSRWQVVCR